MRLKRGFAANGWGAEYRQPCNNRAGNKQTTGLSRFYRLGHILRQKRTEPPHLCPDLHMLRFEHERPSSGER